MSKAIIQPGPLAFEIAAIANGEVGVEEIENTNCGPRVNEYKAATNLAPTKAWPWCAAFVDWVVREAMQGGKYTFKRPTTAGAWALEPWSLAQDLSTNTKKKPGLDILPGDILIYVFSHCGIAITRPGNGRVYAVEGNTNEAGEREGGGVWTKHRKLTEIKTRIRFTV